MEGNKKFMQIQHQIRQNSESVQDYVADLGKWTSEINEKDKDVKQGKRVKPTTKKLPPIRSNKLEQQRLQINKTASYLDTLPTPKTPSQTRP